MTLRILEISAPDKLKKTIDELNEEHKIIDSWHSAKNKDGRRTTSVLVHLDQQQDLMDKLQSKLNKEKGWRITVLPVEATIPKPEEPKEEEKKKKKKKQSLWERIKNIRLTIRRQISREELYNEIESGAEADTHFILLVFLSTIAAAIGLIQGNVAVIIGAMVIAPLLSPNLALTFGVSLGDKDLTIRAIKANVVGLIFTLFFSALMSLIFSFPLGHDELTSRTEVGTATIILALTAGAAGALSLTTGLSGALVGVMVAVALMPPAVAAGLFLGAGDYGHAYGAGLHLAINVICISLSAQLVFFLSGIRPRTWYRRKKTEQSVRINIFFWLALLAIFSALIALRNWL